MNTSQPNHGLDELHTLLDTAYTSFVNDLATTFDLDAGAAQATHPATYSALTDDLAQHLDLDAGLAAIVTGGSLPPPNDTPPHQPASPLQDTDQAQDLEHLRFLDAPTRLALRAAPAFRSLCDALELAELLSLALALDRAPAHALDRALALDPDSAHALDRAVALAPDSAHALDRARAVSFAPDSACARPLARALVFDLTLDSARARALAVSLDRALAVSLDRARAFTLSDAFDRNLALDSAQALARDYVNDLDSARNLALDLDSARARALVLALDRALDNARALAVPLNLARAVALDNARSLAVSLDRARALARALDHTRSHAIDHARPLARALDRDPLDRSLDRALHRAHTRARDLTIRISNAFQLALTVVLGTTYHVASGYSRILGLRLNVGQGGRLDQSAVARARMALAEVGDDFVGVDLRSAQMPPNIDGLVGVQWSNDTQWPSEWVDYVRAASEEIGDGLFQITRTDGKRSATYAAR